MRRKSQLLPGNRPLHVWIYGPPGVGKTKAAIQVAKLGRTLFIAVESGVLPHHFDGIPKENVVLVGPDTMTDFNVIYEKLRVYQTKYYAWAKNPTDGTREQLRLLDEWFLEESIDPVNYAPRPFLFVVVDTLTDIQKDTITFQVPRDSKDFTKTGQMQIQQWGKSNAMLDMITDALVLQEAPYDSLRCNTVWVSHEKQFFNDEGQIIKVCPSLSGQNPALLGAKFDVEAYVKLETKAGSRMQSMIVQKHGIYRNYDVKDRTNKLGDVISDSTAGAGDILIRVMKNCGWLGENILEKK